MSDPEKIAKLILDFPERDVLPPHLLLGSDAQYVFNLAEAARQQAASEWATVTSSTDFKGTDLSFLGGKTHNPRLAIEGRSAAHETHRK